MAKAINPSAINPLIVTGGAGAVSDTIYQVNRVLAFVAAAMELAGDHADDILPINGSSNGLSLVLLTCRAAMEYHLGKEGGAT